MQMGARSWRASLRRLQKLQRAAGEPFACQASPLTDEEREQHYAYFRAQHGVSLPPSYRAFLDTYDGVANVFRGTSLLSCQELLDPAQTRRADTALDDLNTPIPSFVSPIKPQWRDQNLIVIGIDERSEIVFVLDPASRRDDGEMEVIAWIAGLGMRLSSFAQLFDFLADLVEPTDGAQPAAKEAISAAFLAA